MTDEFQRLEGVDDPAIRAEVAHSEIGPAGQIITAETTVPAVDWDAAPIYAEHETVVTTTPVEPVGALAVLYPPRGRWDFTDAQRIVLGLLIWLNILVLVVGYLALTGQLMV